MRWPWRKPSLVAPSATASPPYVFRHPSSEVVVIDAFEGYALERVSTGERLYQNDYEYSIWTKHPKPTYGLWVGYVYPELWSNPLECAVHRARSWEELFDAETDQQIRRQTHVEKRVWRTPS